MNLITLILEKLQLQGDKQLKKAIRGLSGYTTYTLVEALINTSNMSEAANLLGYSINPIKQSIREEISPSFISRQKGSFNNKTGGLCVWRYELLRCIEHRYCNTCKVIKPEKMFYGQYSSCNTCCVLKSKRHKYYIAERTPSWSELEQITQFYENCPSGYHVDHILPLRGKLISGLHVLSNLQYLKALDNKTKNNSFTIE